MASRLLGDELRCAIGLAEAAAGNANPGPELVLDCAYSKRHWAAALRRRPWIAAESKPLLRIVEYEAVDWDAVFSGRVVTNNLCVRKGLSRKAPFATFMRRHVAKCGGSGGGGGCPLASALPETAVIDTVSVYDLRPAWLDFRSALAEALVDAEDLIDAAAAARSSGGPPPLFILKPSLTNKGAEIAVVSGLSAVVAAVREARAIGQWVLQRYVERPLLLDGRKFHLRVYVLLDGALSAYVWGDALVLSAVSPYRPDDGGADRFAHITNTVVGAGHAAFDESRAVRALSEAGPALVESGCVASLSEAAERIAAVWAHVHACVAHALCAFEGDFSGLMPLEGAFELYGFDFMLDADWRVYLLEANPTPDIRQTGARLDPMIGALIEGVASIALDSRYPPPLPAAREWGGGSGWRQPELRPEWRWTRVLERQWAGAGGSVGLSTFGDAAP